MVFDFISLNIKIQINIVVMTENGTIVALYGYTGSGFATIQIYFLFKYISCWLYLYLNSLVKILNFCKIAKKNLKIT